MSPMWLTSKMPTPVRTAMCSLMIPQPIAAGYSTGISQPLKSTIVAPIWRWTALSAVLRMMVAVPAGVASTDDKVQPQSASRGTHCSACDCLPYHVVVRVVKQEALAKETRYEGTLSHLYFLGTTRP